MTNSEIIIHVGLQKTTTTFPREVVFPALKGVVYVGSSCPRESRAINSLQSADGSLYPDSMLREVPDRIGVGMARYGQEYPETYFDPSQSRPVSDQ